MERRSLCIVMACACALLGCARVVFDHSSSSAGGASGDGGPASGGQCEGAADGMRCDDRNACTPSSICKDERCVPGNGFETCVLADSSADYGVTQGSNDWFYGYWNATADPDGSYDSQVDFSEMEYCDDNNWRPPGRCGMDSNAPDYRWTTNLAWSLQHPETEPDMELPIRRWVSDASGPVTILADHHVGGDFGDGTRALLLVDGLEVWRNDAVAGDEAGVQASLEVELRMGTIVEQVVHPIGSSADDTTYFSIVVEGR